MIWSRKGFTGSETQACSGMVRIGSLKPASFATSELDPVMSATIAEIIGTLKDQYHVTSIVVSHDRDLALNISDRVGILMGGKLVFLGTREELQKTKDPKVSGFLYPKIDVKNPRFKELET